MRPPKTGIAGALAKLSEVGQLPEMSADLPRQCDLGGKRDSHGNNHYGRGYKLHWDVADGQIPISAVLTSASVHDSQVAIPLATTSTQRVTYCYELMDAAYDAHHIAEQSRCRQPLREGRTPDSFRVLQVGPLKTFAANPR